MHALKRLLPGAVLFALLAGSTAAMPPPAFAETRTAAASHDQIASNDGTKLYVQAFGRGSPVVLLAGGPGLNPVYMQPVWEDLARRHRVIVLHQRGTGKSILPVVDAAHLSVDAYVDDLEALRKHLGLQKLVLVGHSWGGMLAMLYLSRQPAHVEKLVLLDPGGLDPSFMKPFGENLRAKLTESDLAMLQAGQAAHDPNLELKAKWPGYFYDRDRALATRSGADGAFGQDGVGKFAMPSYFANSEAMIQALKGAGSVPVILIKGKQDPIDESVATSIATVLPQTEIKLIDDLRPATGVVQRGWGRRESRRLAQRAAVATGMRDRHPADRYVPLRTREDAEARARSSRLKSAVVALRIRQWGADAGGDAGTRRILSRRYRAGRRCRRRAAASPSLGLWSWASWRWGSWPWRSAS